MVDEPLQQQHEHDHEHGRNDRDPVRGRAEDRDRAGHERQRRICLRLAAGGVERHVLQQVAHADGRDHDGHTRRAAQGLIGRALDDEAEQDRQHEHERNGHIHRQRRAHFLCGLSGVFPSSTIE